ncbi:IclR family transcriptional regulator [Staphylococcus lugdunensis]|uniref:IclR family transcriptional regulator n=1 Tax=Staphylococcus TaxID=1279 RepID=UPI001CD921F1|nr:MULTISPECIES: IclR family transcriptional regulator [Staphylococcus]MDK7860773.1 IclR family transcriptional regulator [Staphylococcus lugdunensis]MDK8287815.1 IclR family transcriptional regulator [Staphylococcus lugdunensis]MDU7270470.1 IclR family transcriptional regulator [Staphylococcus lugdunensis]
MVKSAQRVFDILNLLHLQQHPLSEKEIGQALQIPASSLFNLLKTMVEANYIRKDYQNKYLLGSKLISLGNRAREDLDLYNESLSYIKHLSDEFNETIFLAYPQGYEMIYLTKIDSHRSIRTAAQPGANKPIYTTGLGKACLYMYDKKLLDCLFLDIEFEQVTPYTVKNYEMLKVQLRRFKAQGYAIDDEENELGLYCIAAPILNDAGHVIGAISCAGPKERIQHNDLIPQKIKQNAYFISRAMGLTRNGVDIN